MNKEKLIAKNEHTPTQEDIDNFFKEAKAEWNKMVSDSGLSQSVFVATSHEAFEFIHIYEQVRIDCESAGLNLPPIVDGIEVTYHE